MNACRIAKIDLVVVVKNVNVGANFTFTALTYIYYDYSLLMVLL